MGEGCVNCGVRAYAVTVSVPVSVPVSALMFVPVSVTVSLSVFVSVLNVGVVSVKIHTSLSSGADVSVEVCTFVSARRAAMVPADLFAREILHGIPSHIPAKFEHVHLLSRLPTYV